MLKVITDACDLLCPIVNLKIRTNTPGWFTADIIEMVNQKHELTNIVSKKNSVENCDKLEACKKELRKMLRKAKQDLVITSLNDNHTNSRKFWKILNEDLGLKSKNAQDTCVQLRTGDGSTCEGQDLSNFLSNYYATNGKLLAEGIPNTPPGTHEDCFPEIRTTFKFRFVPLTVI